MAQKQYKKKSIGEKRRDRMQTLSEFGFMPEYAELAVNHRADDVWSERTQMYERYYQIGDMPSMPSVTTVLDMIGKPGLRDWKMNKAWEHAYGVAIKEPWPQCPETELKRPKTSWRARLDALKRESKAAGPTLLDRARKIGEDVHGAIAAELLNQPYVMQHLDDFNDKDRDQFDIAMRSFFVWYKEHVTSGEKLQALWTEQTIWSPEHLYAGSPDVVLTDGSKLIVADWKTGAGIYPEYGVQVSAYANGIQELTGFPIDECRVVHLSKNEVGYKEYFAKDWTQAFKSFKASLHLFNAWHDGILTSNDS